MKVENMEMIKKFNKEEYGKMCAEFLGWELKSDTTYMDTPFSGRSIWFSPTSSDGKTRTFACEKGKEFFDSDWNWIMEVVEKIETLFHGFVLFKIEDENCFVAITSVQNYNNYTTMATKKEAVVHAIWHFLNWYKENKS